MNSLKNLFPLLNLKFLKRKYCYVMHIVTQAYGEDFNYFKYKGTDSVVL